MDMDEEELNIGKEKLKQEILELLKKHNYTNKLSECPITTLKFLLKIDNACLDTFLIYGALCELQEEDKVIKSFELSDGNLSVKINSSRWYLKQ
ncbi:hypothetical protein [Clostridium sp. BJN0013]|uniref:hypothetical protein n=1 Tax=Clostridium sp. BJN0013 TaxID=3236840 RepID=UPI0034C5F11E